MLSLKAERPPLAAVAFVLALGSATSVTAHDTPSPISSEPLISAQTTIIGQPLSYPTEAPAEISASIVTIPPGVAGGWHIHPAPLFGYMLEGELTVDYGTEGTRVYRQGDSLLEATDWPHQGTNTGDGPVRVLIVFMGAEGLSSSVAVDPPNDGN